MPVKLSAHAMSIEEQILQHLKKLPKDEGYTSIELAKLLNVERRRITEVITCSKKLQRCKVKIYNNVSRIALINPNYIK